MLSVSANAPLWAARSATAGDGNVFKRPAQDPQTPSGSTADARGRDAAQGAAKDPHTAKGAGKAGQSRLKPADVRQVEELAERERQVRAHEAAHQAAAGSLGGAASFTYQTGPDGKSYAVGGEVPVDMSGGRTPEETAARAAQIRSAALAPADPSPQDMAVAAQATVMEAEARQQIANEHQLGAGSSSGHGRSASAIRPTRHGVEIPILGQKSTGAGRASDAGVAPTQASSPATASTPETDVSTEAAAATAVVETGGSSTAPISAQLRQLARLATIAYRR